MPNPEELARQNIDKQLIPPAGEPDGLLAQARLSGLMCRARGIYYDPLVRCPCDDLTSAWSPDLPQSLKQKPARSGGFLFIVPGETSCYFCASSEAELSRRCNSCSACAGVRERTNPHSPSRVLRDCFRIIWSLSFIGFPSCFW
jgi:hypothetical protein